MDPELNVDDLVIEAYGTVTPPPTNEPDEGEEDTDQ